MSVVAALAAVAVGVARTSRTDVRPVDAEEVCVCPVTHEHVVYPSCAQLPASCYTQNCISNSSSMGCLPST